MVNAIDNEWVSYFVNPAVESSFAWSQFVIIALCVFGSFKAHSKPHSTLIMAGLSVLFVRQLVLLLFSQDSLAAQLAAIDPVLASLALLMSLLLGIGLTTIGLARSFAPEGNTIKPIAPWIPLIFFGVASIEICVLGYRLLALRESASVDPFQEVSLIAALLIVTLALQTQKRETPVAEYQSTQAKKQLTAMMSMFRAVKHDLNNDMQVILGNAELAENLIELGNGDIRKPVNNVSEAAAMAVERIQQLSAFSTKQNINLCAVDLNVILEECVNKLNNEIPLNVDLQLDPGDLSVNAMADRYLLNLSLIHLIRQAIKTMDLGGSIVVSSYVDKATVNDNSQRLLVMAEVNIARKFDQALYQTTSTDQKLLAAHNELLELGLTTTKALVERSGAVKVGHTMTLNESTIRMGFISEQFSNSTSNQVVPNQSRVATASHR